MSGGTYILAFYLGNGGAKEMEQKIVNFTLSLCALCESI